VAIVSRPRRRTTPRIPRDLLVLPRLTRLLDQWAPITLVRGLQGYGKTTLVAEWARTQPDTVNVVWFTASAALRDPSTLMRNLDERLDLVFGAPGAQLPASSQSSPADQLPSANRRGPADVLDRIDRAAAVASDEESLLLVIDNAQYVQDHEFLNRLVELVAAHQNLHLVLIGRGQHPIEQVALGRVDAFTITPRTLLLSADEIIELAQVMGVPLSDDQAVALHAEIGGWLAVARVVLVDVVREGGPLPLARAHEYLRHSVLTGIIDQRTLAQVMRFSLAPRLTYQLVRDLARGIEPDELVSMMELAGLAERRYGGVETELVLPSLVRTVLNDEFLRRDPDGAREMHDQLAAWYSAQANPDDTLLAFEQAALATDWNRVDEIWAEHASDLGLARAGEVLTVLDALPAGILAARPGMVVARALIAAFIPTPDTDVRIDTRTAPLRAYIEASTRALDGGVESLPLPDLLFAGTGHLIGLRLAGRFDQAEQFGDAIEHRATRLLGAGSGTGDHLSWFYLQRGLTSTLLGRHNDAIRRYQRAWQYRRRSSVHVLANVNANLALTYALRGEPLSADLWLERCREIDATGSWGYYLGGLGAHLAVGLLAFDRLDSAAAQDEVDYLGNGAGAVELWPYIAALHGQYGLHYSDPVVTLATLDAAMRTHQIDLSAQPSTAALLVRVRADLLIASGQAGRARQLLTSGDAAHEAPLVVALARISLLSGDNSGTRRRIAEVFWLPSTPDRERLELALINAQATYRSGEPQIAGPLMGQAITMSQRTGLLRPFTTIPAAERAELFGLTNLALSANQLRLLEEHPGPFPDQVTVVALTKREQLLATALFRTSSRQTIADELYVSINTVKRQLLTLYDKLEVSNRDEALMKLRELGFE
jgi:LuxR family transcriptional regulator, maltose regulon positive regulatory protein